MVVSHDCEFNDGKRQFFLAARLELLPQNMINDNAAMEEMRAGNDYLARSVSGNPIAVDAFFLEPIEGVIPLGMVATFTSITPFSMGFRDNLLRLKQAEMQHDPHRLQLRDKLSIFFGRDAEDVPDTFKIARPTDPATLTWTDVPLDVSAETP